MKSAGWLARSASLLRPGLEPKAMAALSPAGEAAPRESKAKAGTRSMRERLKATLRRQEEALSPRVLRRTLMELQAIIDPNLSDVEGGRRAEGVAAWYSKASAEERRDCWLLMSEQFVADPQKASAAQALYAAAIGTPDEAAAEVRLRRATVSPRRRLLQRFSVFPGGIRFLVDMRAEILGHVKTDQRLQALDVEMEYMFSTWFDVGFLDLRRLSWDSPASLLEKLIKYEAVHDIQSWADLKNRLDSDRRCYGFFHPRLPDEPLIFVEVALMDEIATAITPLLDEAAAPADLNKATWAVFYSINNTQAGLRGVSFGDSLIKRVVETLKAEFPKLRNFTTLSPMPGFRAWLRKEMPELLKGLDNKQREALRRIAGTPVVDADQVMQLAGDPLTLGEKSPVRQLLLQWAAHYLVRGLTNGRPLDPVARFHLGNGARVERLDWGADPSAKGLKQSYGLMVNYLYDLKRLDKHRGMLRKGLVPASSEVQALLD
jgi:malonyl-CoA decarboxylase